MAQPKGNERVTAILQGLLNELTDEKDFEAQETARTFFAAGSGLGFSHFNSAMSGTRHLPLDHVQYLARALAEKGGSSYGVRFLQEICGDHFRVIPEDLPDEEDDNESLLDTLKECGDVVSVVSKALSDGKVSRREAKRLTKELHESIAAQHRALRAIERMANK